MKINWRGFATTFEMAFPEPLRPAILAVLHNDPVRPKPVDFGLRVDNR